jgi:IS1 family transposase
MQEYRELYENFIDMFKKCGLLLNYMVIDELYTFTRKKSNKCYVWVSVVVTVTGRKFYVYHVSKSKSAAELLNFDLTLPDTDKVYCDGNLAYDSVYGSVVASMKKSKFTNIVENVNSQIRDKVSYLVRKSKAHAKSMEWLKNRLSMFFVNLNIKG